MEMSSNYPEGSMNGSGIYSQEITMEITCPEEECRFTGEVLMSTNDSVTAAYGKCPECEADLEESLDEEDLGKDEDAEYDAWRESQMDRD
jgi:hypothetical protein